MKFGILFRWGSLWVGAHWSAKNRRLCINPIPLITLWVTLPGGTPPGRKEHRPMQPLVRDDNGVIRFKRNEIVRLLLDNGPYTLSHLAQIPLSIEDREQFAQLIGYSLCGFYDLSYVSEETKMRAEAQERPK